MAVAGQIVTSDRRPFTAAIQANTAVPDLTVVQGCYFYVLRGNGRVEQWGATIEQQTAQELLASYAPQPGDDDTAGETIHVRPYLQIPSMPDTPCEGFELQIIAR